MTLIGPRQSGKTTLVRKLFKDKPYANSIHAPLMFFRDQTGNEIDLLIPRGAQHQPVEIKSGQTLSPAWLDRLKWFGRTFPEQDYAPALLVHPRDGIQKRSEVTVTSHLDFAQSLPVK